MTKFEAKLLLEILIEREIKGYDTLLEENRDSEKLSRLFQKDVDTYKELLSMVENETLFNEKE
ncbi:MAG: hypothetical protein IJW82_01250 [Clostridia bacterium]|nr:hypothetical protein [Clostridia bacterium]